MGWPFSKATRENAIPPLVFKDGEGFLKSQCEFGHTDIKPNQGIVALVLDAAKEFGVNQSVKIEDDGRQLAMLKVASEDGGFLVASHTPTGDGDRLKPGDVVIWVPVKYADEFSKDKAGDLDPRMGWVGFIVAKIKPEIDVSKDSFEIICEYA